MKKIIIIIVVLLLLAGAGGGAYYYFFMMNEEEPAEEEVLAEPEQPGEEAALPTAEPAMKMNQEYYVTSGRLNVRGYPEKNAQIRSVLRKGDSVTALEMKGDWVRISDYMVHDSGRDIAGWIHMNYLSPSKPEITPEEKRKTIAALIKKSDDMLEHQDQFILSTQSLIDKGICSFEDFELLGGWIRSVNYQSEPVYFIYCGGTERANKVYLNAKTGDIFYPD